MNVDQFAKQATDEYELFLTALNGLYLQALTPGSRPTPKDVVDFSRKATDMRDALRARLNANAAEAVTEAEEGVDQGTKATLRSLLAGLQTEIARISALNVHAGVNLLRIGRDELGKTFQQALSPAMGQLLIKKLQKIEFKVPDPAGRKWDSERFFSFVIREFNYRVNLFVTMAKIDGLAEVVYPDHDSDGVVFAPKGDFNSYPSYADLEKTVFHPNSKAKVVPYALA